MSTCRQQSRDLQFIPREAALSRQRHIRSANPHDAPLIDPNSFADT